MTWVQPGVTIICGKLHFDIALMVAQILTQPKGRRHITGSVRAVFTLVASAHTSHWKVVSQELPHVVQADFVASVR